MGKTISEIHGILKTAFANNVIYRTQTFLSCFLISNMGKLCLKTLAVQVIPPKVIQMKVWRKFAKLVTETDKAAFWRSLVGLASTIEHSSV
jgi:hypothetical protein